MHLTGMICSWLYIDRCITVKPIVAHGVKADRLSSVRWKDNHISHVYCKDRVILAAFRCIEFILLVGCASPDI